MLLFIRNANIHTMDDHRPLASAALVEDGRFIFVGSERGAQVELARRGPADETVDMEGRLVLPGFNDSHMHFIHFAKSLRSVSLTGVCSIQEIQQRMAQAVAARDPQDPTWLEGEGWNQDYFTEGEKRFPTRADLDAVSPDVPMMIMRACFHIGVLNSAALRAIGLNRETAPQYGDLVGVDANGEPDGIIKESFLDDTKAVISSLTLDSMKQIIVAAQQKALAQGITSLQSDDVGYTPKADYHLLFQAFGELEREGKLHIRVAEQCLLQKTHLIQQFFADGYDDQWGTAFFRPSCIKLLSDGSLGARSAKLFEPYDDAPDTDGILVTSQEKMNRTMLEAYEKGLQPAIHCIGDKALECVLDAIEYTLDTARSRGMTEREQKTRLPFRLIHVQMTHPEQIERMKRLPVILDVQPSFLCTDLHWIEERIGKARAKHSYQWKTMIDAGLMLTGSSDCPVESFSPWQGIFAAVTRKDIHGYPSEGYHPEEQVSVYDAVCMFSKNIPYANGEQDLMGTITEGKFADMVVIDRDIFQIPHDDILNIQVLRTEMAGETTYEK